MQLWYQETAGRWARVPIELGLRIGCDDDGCVVAGEGATSALATIIPFEEHAKGRAALVSTPETLVTVNGYPALGCTLLEDRDEIVIRSAAAGDHTRFIFTELEPVAIVRFSEAVAGAKDEGRCARCRKPLRSGDAAVRCPLCKRWYHEGRLSTGGERGCWRYDVACGGCHTTRASMSWSPAAGEECEDGEGDADGTDGEAAA